MPKNIRSDATFVSVNVRSRKNCIGSIGAVARSSQRTNPTTRSAPTTIGTTTPALVQPCSLPRTRPQTTPRSPMLASADAGQVETGSPARATRRGSAPRAERGRGRSARSARRSSATRHRRRSPRRRAGRARSRARRCRPRSPSARPRCSLRHTRREDRQRERRDDRAADALHCAREVELRRRRRERGAPRRRR